jgi:chromatin-remodeling ATPase INO80
MAKPLHIQRLEKALDISSFMKYAESVLSKNDEIENSSDEEGVRAYENAYQDKELMFNSEHIGADRKWLFNLLLSETESESEISDTDKYIGEMLKEHVREKKFRHLYHKNPNVSLSYVIIVLLSNNLDLLERPVWLLQCRSRFQGRHVS